jgi:hypothetical protein
MDRVELVGTARDDLPLDRLLQPRPLKHRRLENRGRCIRVIFQQFRGTVSVKAEVEPAVEAGLVAVPAFGNQRPERFRYLQSAQRAFVVDRMSNEFEAHRVDFPGGLFDLTLDLIQREGIIGAFVPIALAVDGVKIKPGFVSGSAPVVALGANNALHEMILAHFGWQRASRRGHDHHGRHVRAHEIDAAHRRSRHRLRGNRACRPGQVPACPRARSPLAAQSPSTRRRRLQFPSWSR